MEKVFPQVVKTNKTPGDPLPGGTKMLAYGDLVSPIIEAIKELSHKFDELFTKYLDQQTEIDSLKSRLDKLEAVQK